MGNINDNKILELKQQIESKRKKIGDIKRFSPITTCIITIDDKTFNINTLSEEALDMLLVKINMYRMSAQKLGIPNFKISGFKVDEWIEDIMNKNTITKQKREINELKAMSEKLDNMLSNDKKIELELDEIANLLK